MITPEKLAIYRKFNGDVDGWQRMGCPNRDVFTDGDWTEIGNLLQELTLLKRGFAAADYAERIRQKLSFMTSDVDTAQAMMDLA